MSIANSWRMSGDIYDAFTRPDALCSCDDAKDPHCIAPGRLAHSFYVLLQCTDISKVLIALF
jgi:hypothetical protein